MIRQKPDSQSPQAEEDSEDSEDRHRQSVEERRAADASRAGSRPGLLEVFGDIILPRLNENCVVVGVAVMSSQKVAHST